jgi:hypothetical protein
MKRSPRVPGEADPAGDPPATDPNAGDAPPAEEMSDAEKKAAAATVAEFDAPAAVRPTGKLPHPSTVDPRKIKRSVLTSQGWICPEPTFIEKR